jgi:hypothetical protein
MGYFFCFLLPKFDFLHMFSLVTKERVTAIVLWDGHNWRNRPHVPMDYCVHSPSLCSAHSNTRDGWIYCTTINKREQGKAGITK